MGRREEGLGLLYPIMAARIPQSEKIRLLEEELHTLLEKTTNIETHLLVERYEIETDFGKEHHTGSVEIPRRVLYDRSLLPSAKIIYAILWDHIHDGRDLGEPEEIATISGYGLSVIERILKQLEELGYIEEKDGYFKCDPYDLDREVING